VKNRWRKFCASPVVNPTILLSLLLILAGIVAYVRLQSMWDISTVDFINEATTSSM
jgi:hypothetical protein